MAKAEGKSTRHPIEEPYAELADVERPPPYFGEREPVSRRGPATHFITVKLEGGSDLAAAASLLASAASELQVSGSVRADTDQYYLVNLSSGPPPLPALKWLEAAAARLRTSPLDQSRGVSDVARQLQHEMYEAVRRGQCDAAWTSWRSIENLLIKQEWWPRARPPRR
jgi:hypothetical protein